MFTRIALIAFIVSFAQSHAASVDGVWKGTTNCAGQRTEYEIKIEGETADIGYKLHGPQGLTSRNYAATVSTGHNSRGNWVEFQGDSGYAAGQLVGTTSMRLSEGTDFPDCNAYVLTRVSESAVAQRAPEAPAGNPRSREPTREEMRSALEAAARQASSNTLRAEIVNFEKLGCVLAQSRPGYLCDYSVEVSTQVGALGGGEDAANHANALQLLLNGLIENSGMKNIPVRRRFLYVESRRSWMVLQD